MLSYTSGTSPRAGLVPLVLLCLLVGCASPRPVLYPNEHLEAVGTEASEQDVEACMEMAKNAELEKNRAAETAKTTATGAAVGAVAGVAVGAITGSPGTGAAVGAAGGGIGGFFRGIFGSREPTSVYKGFVDTCLRERGYQPVGWK